ncbi:MAG: oligoendopeptidase F [Clostridia bacterium]|nr:oligoendopeptidase F [Clostridia bacterium]
MPKERSQVKREYVWATEDIFGSTEEWNAAYDKLAAAIDYKKFTGKLGDKKIFLEYCKKDEAVASEFERVAIYAHLKHDEDSRNSEYASLMARVYDLEVKYGSETAFVVPELTALDESVLKSYIADPDLKDYDYMLSLILKQKPHVLSVECEQLLALGGKVYGGFREIFGMLDNADMKFDEIEVDGEKVKLSHGTYGVLLAHKDQSVRAEAFKTYYKSYISHINTLAQIYIGNVNKDVFFARARKYEGCLDYALSNEDVSVKVYDNLLEAVNGALPLMHEYIRLRKNALGVKELHMYDLHVPIVEGADLKLDFEEAFKLVKEGLAPLGKDYIALLDKAKAERWMDVEETVGKRSGAYSSGVYSIKHPYVLLNYQPTTHDVFTIAHELGHAMHTYHSNKYQPQAKADYKIFVAEVASTVNEVLLLKHILGTCTDVKLKKYLLSYYMDMIRTTLFRQTMFAEFEYIAHAKAERGEPLTKDNMNAEYLALNKKYYGEAVVHDDEIAYEWARIPHFYRAFYVYKYATGIISAISIAERIYSEGEAAVRDYFKFLSSGGSDSPVELLKLSGVDLTEKAAFDAAMKSFENTLEEFKKL